MFRPKHKEETGFFKDIRGYFKAEYEGRYLAIILCELAKNEPKSFADLIKIIAKNENAILKEKLRTTAAALSENKIDAAIEKTLGNKRRADLAFLHDKKIIALFEIKENDVKSKENPAQLSDYIDYTRKENVLFIHLSRYALPDAEQKQIDEAKKEGLPVICLRYRDLYNYLEKTNGSIAEMVCKYLEDIGVAKYKPIETEQEKSLAFMLKKMLGFPHADGMGRLNCLATVSGIPDVIKLIFSNLEYLGDMLQEVNKDKIKTSFSREFLPRPEFDLPKLTKALMKEELDSDGSEELPGTTGKYVQAGEVDFYAYGRIASKDFLYVAVGYSFRIEKGKSDGGLVDYFMYVGFWGKGLEYDSEVIECGKEFPSEKNAIKTINDCLKKALLKAKKADSISVKKSLEDFKLLQFP